MSNGIDVIDRESSSFISLISYNCSLMNSTDLSIWVNQIEVDYCLIIRNELNRNMINVTCHSIENQAGQNWSFTIGGKNFDDEQIIINESLTITLKPLCLNTSTKINVEIDIDLNLARIFVLNCLNITNVEYVVVRCNNSDPSTNNHSNNCTYICSNIQSGSILNSSLIRLSIPIIDQRNETFPEENLQILYVIG